MFTSSDVLAFRQHDEAVERWLEAWSQLQINVLGAMVANGSSEPMRRIAGLERERDRLIKIAEETLSRPVDQACPGYASEVIGQAERLQEEISELTPRAVEAASRDPDRLERILAKLQSPQAWAAPNGLIHYPGEAEELRLFLTEADVSAMNERLVEFYRINPLPEPMDTVAALVHWIDDRTKEMESAWIAKRWAEGRPVQSAEPPNYDPESATVAYREARRRALAFGAVVGSLAERLPEATDPVIGLQNLHDYLASALRPENVAVTQAEGKDKPSESIARSEERPSEKDINGGDRSSAPGYLGLKWDEKYFTLSRDGTEDVVDLAGSKLSQALVRLLLRSKDTWCPSNTIITAWAESARDSAPSPNATSVALTALRKQFLKINITIVTKKYEGSRLEEIPSSVDHLNVSTKSHPQPRPPRRRSSR